MKPSFQHQGLIACLQVLKGLCLVQRIKQEHFVGCKAHQPYLKCLPGVQQGPPPKLGTIGLLQN